MPSGMRGLALACTLVTIGCSSTPMRSTMPSLSRDSMSEQSVAALKPGTMVDVRTSTSVYTGEYHGQTETTILVIDGSDRIDVTKNDILQVARHRRGNSLTPSALAKLDVGTSIVVRDRTHQYEGEYNGQNDKYVFVAGASIPKTDIREVQKKDEGLSNSSVALIIFGGVVLTGGIAGLITLAAFANAHVGPRF